MYFTVAGTGGRWLYPDSRVVVILLVEAIGMVRIINTLLVLCVVV